MKNVLIIVAAVGGFFVLLFGIGLVVAIFGSDADQPPTNRAPAATPAASASAAAPAAEPQPEKEKDPVVEVKLEELIADYRDNELAADQKWKGKKIGVVGLVADVKKDFIGNPYVKVGTGKRFENWQIRCTVHEKAISEAVALKKGQGVYVTGTVRGLTMMSVMMEPCGAFGH